MGDADYLACLGDALRMGLEKFEPELICYIAGADPYREDQLGGLSLTIEGLKQRDRLVFQTAKTRGIPVMVTLAGGYAAKVEDTITIHCNTMVAAKEVFSRTELTYKSADREKNAEAILLFMDVVPSQLPHRELYNILISAVVPRPIAWVSSSQRFRTT